MNTAVAKLVGGNEPLLGMAKVGKNYVGLCPFHYERTPSFVVAPDEMTYRCLGCGVSGKVDSIIRDERGT